MIPSVLESLAFWTGIAAVGCTAAAALFGCLARSFPSRASTLRTEGTGTASAETIAALEKPADWTGRATVFCTAAAAGFGCLVFLFSSNVAEMKDEARSRFETESKTKMKNAEEGTAQALAEAATAKENMSRLEVEAARLREQAAIAEAKIKGAEVRAAEANERSAKAGEGTAKALAEAASAKENTSRLEVEAARLREQATAAEVKIKAAEARAAEANERSAMAGEGTAKALAEVASARENTSRLEIEAASLRERAARAEKELIEVQERIKPRHITDAQRVRLIQALKPIPKGPIGITTTIGDGEARILAGQIQALLKASGWEDVHISQALFNKPMIGVMIELHDLRNIPLFAVPLLNAFHSNDISKTLAYNPEVPEGKINIVVGMKPDP